MLTHQHLDHIRDAPRRWCAWQPGQAFQPRTKELHSKVASRVDAAGRKMTSDVILVAEATRIFLDEARGFLNENGS